MDKDKQQLNDIANLDKGYELYGQKRVKQNHSAKAVFEQLRKRKMDDKGINMREQPNWGVVKGHLTSSPTGIEKPELVSNIIKRVKTRPLR